MAEKTSRRQSVSRRTCRAGRRLTLWASRTSRRVRSSRRSSSCAPGRHATPRQSLLSAASGWSATRSLSASRSAPRQNSRALRRARSTSRSYARSWRLIPLHGSGHVGAPLQRLSSAKALRSIDPRRFGGARSPNAPKVVDLEAATSCSPQFGPSAGVGCGCHCTGRRNLR
jgi:hypothetical protein